MNMHAIHSDLRSVAAEINETGRVAPGLRLALEAKHGVEPGKVDAVAWAQRWAYSMLHHASNPLPIAMRGLYPPHRPTGTPSRKDRRGASRHAVPISTRTARGKGFTVRNSAPARQTGRGA